VWIFADELPTLHKLPDLVEILPEARKFGGCYVFGIQSYAQLEDIYGVKPAATLFDVMNTRAFSAPRVRRLPSLPPAKSVRKKSSRPASSIPTVQTRCVTGVDREGKRAGNAGQLLRHPDAA
jgi:hypothetical protein